MPLLKTILDYIQSGLPVIKYSPNQMRVRGAIIRPNRYKDLTIYIQKWQGDEGTYTTLVHEFLHLDCMKNRCCSFCGKPYLCPREEEFERMCKRIYDEGGMVMEILRRFVYPLEEARLNGRKRINHPNLEKIIRTLKMQRLKRR